MDTGYATLISMGEPPQQAEGRQPFAWSVLEMDDDLVVVNKPAGLLVHRPERGRGWEWEALLQQVRVATGGRVHAVHRLDRGTSGVMVLARHREAAARLSAAFREGRVQKVYRAVVRGWPPDAGRIDRPLRSRDGGPERAAVTEFRVLARAELPWPSGGWSTSRYALVEAQPESGRWHQIRRHLRGLAHPVIGDTTHGDGTHNRLFREHFDCHRLLLHAFQLSLPHPRDGGIRTWQAEPDPVWQRCMRAFE